MLFSLRDFRFPVWMAYYVGTVARNLPGPRQSENDMLLAGLFMRRVLAHYRAIWKLTHQGYASQAAILTASLIEDALSVMVTANHPERAMSFIEKEDGRVPWNVRQMCQFVGVSTGDDGIGRRLYSDYRWLCQIKHPTLRASMHEAGASNFSGEFANIALPDARPEDLPLKRRVLRIATVNLLLAAVALREGAGIDSEGPTTREFDKLIEEAARRIPEGLFEEHLIPFTGADSDMFPRGGLLTEDSVRNAELIAMLLKIPRRPS